MKLSTTVLILDVLCNHLSEGTSLYQWQSRHQGSAAVRAPLSFGGQQPAFGPCGQINSSQNIITFHTQVFSEAPCANQEYSDKRLTF